MHLTKGNLDSRVWIIGDFPTVDDEVKKEVFSGSMGNTLREITLASLNLDECCVLNLTSLRPYKRATKDLFSRKPKPGFIPFRSSFCNEVVVKEYNTVLEMLHKHQPELVIGLGELPLVMFTGLEGITSIRGSQLVIPDLNIKFMPTYNPYNIMRKWEWSYSAKHDIARAMARLAQGKWGAEIPPIQTFPSKDEVIQYLSSLPAGDVALDVETRSRHIRILGFSSSVGTIAIPLLANNNSYYTFEEEFEILLAVKAAFSRDDITYYMHNAMYDLAYLARDWGMIPKHYGDTMCMWHCAYAGLEKSLAFVSSLLLDDYVYWKDADPDDEEEYNKYNCLDTYRTLQLVPKLKQLLGDLKLGDIYAEQISLYPVTLRMTFRGVKQNMEMRSKVALEVMQEMSIREQFFIDVTPGILGSNKLTKGKNAKPWYNSPTQQQTIFYELFKLPCQFDKHTGRPTFNDAAIKKLLGYEPLLDPVLLTLTEYRSLGVFLSTFVLSPLDHDKRMRCSYGVGMTETFRFTSSSDPFGFGGNLQNIPKGNTK